MSVETQEQRIRRAQILVEALPYIRRFSGQIIVVKLGGAAASDSDIDLVLQDLVLLRFVGMKPVLVHGGGPEISAMQAKLGQTAQFRDGLRVTDAAAMEVVKMVLTGKVGPDIVARLHRLGGNAIGISGEDGPTLLVRRHTTADGGDIGYVGDVEHVNVDPIVSILDQGCIPVVASIGLGYDGEAYNVNADTVAAELAVALHATKMIMLTDVPGVAGSDGELLTEIDAPTAQRLIGEAVISGGMIPKVRAALRALDSVEAAHIIDGRVPHALLLEVLTDGGVGTMVTRSGTA